MPEELLQDVQSRLANLSDQAPIKCPFLDTTKGECMVYDARPVACRTYGFYVERGIGLYCTEMESQVASGEFNQVVWGNAESVEESLNELGEQFDLRELYAAEAWARIR